MGRKTPQQTSRPKKLVSGGQTGVDRAALETAIDLGIPHGGWCPRGRLAEDGRIPSRYHLRETESPEYRVRTERNVLDSDGTLILCPGAPTGGTELTFRLCQRHGKPCLLVDLNQPVDPEAPRRWIAEHRIKVLNVAGPRESQSPGIAARAREVLRRILARKRRTAERGKRGRGEDGEGKERERGEGGNGVESCGVAPLHHARNLLVWRAAPDRTCRSARGAHSCRPRSELTRFLAEAH